MSIPININQVHWYLAVVNAKKHQIQVLDSLGTMLGRKVLELTVSDCCHLATNLKLLMHSLVVRLVYLNLICTNLLVLFVFRLTDWREK